MPTARVTTPAGLTWTVRRRWIPHREGIGLRARLGRRSRAERRARRRGDDARWYDALDIPDFGVDLDGFAIVVALIVAIVLLALFGWPLALVGIDLAWALLAGIIGTIGRVVLGRPWRVEARSGDERRQWYVQGFRAAGRARDDVARRLQHGQNPLPGDTTSMAH